MNNLSLYQYDNNIYISQKSIQLDMKYQIYIQITMHLSIKCIIFTQNIQIHHISIQLKHNITSNIAIDFILISMERYDIFLSFDAKMNWFE
jgi:hypothetical protein